MLFSIELFNFRNYPNRTYKFDNQVTLVKGVSGSGKSSILSAIEWCLFGKQKNVVPLKFKGKKCISFVTITTDNFEIKRRKINNELTITIEDEVFTGDEAQSSIDFIFGDRERFNILCYIQQKKINQFFELKDSDKFEFLNRLSYENESVRNLKNKIIEQTQSLREEFKTIEVIFKYDNQRMMNEFSNVNCEFDSSLNLEELITQNESMNKSNIQMTDDINHFTLTKQTIKSLEEEIKISNQEIELIKLLTDDEVKLIQYELDGLKHFKDQLILKNEVEKSIEQIRLKLSKINLKIELGNIKFSEKQIQETFYLEKKYNENRKISIELGLEDYSSLTVNQIEELKSQLNLQVDLNKKNESFKKFKSLNEQLKLKIKEHDSIMIVNQDQLNTEIKEYELQLEELKGLSLQCPVCQSNLKLKNNNILTVQSSSSHSLDIDQLKSKINELKNNSRKNEVASNKKRQLSNDIEQLKSMIELMFGDEVFNDLEGGIKEINLKQVGQRLNLLNKIELIRLNESLSSDDMILHNKKLELSIQLNEQMIKLNKFNDINEVKYSIDDLDSKVNQLKTQLKNQQKNSFHFKILDEQIMKSNYKLKQLNESIRYSVDEIEQMKMMIDRNKIRIKSNEQIIVQLKECKRRQELQESIQLNELKMNQLMKDITSLNNLKLSIESLECKFLKKLIETVNHYMNYCLSNLFREEIKVTLTLESVTKSKKNIISMNIIKQGDIYPDISYLSGGELDRLSLAFSISLNRIFDCMFISLDEIFSSLDIEARLKCVDLFKELHLNVIVISHDEIEGTFDQVIDID